MSGFTRRRDKSVFEFVKRNGLARRIATRFVSGETLDSAIRAGRALNAAGRTVSLDLLGESVTNPECAATSRRVSWGEGTTCGSTSRSV